MPANTVNFGAFTYDEYFWTGKHKVAWLAPDVHFIIQADPEAIPPHQRTIVEFICSLPAETRDRLEDFLFVRYQAEVFGSIDPVEYTPPIKKSSEIWNLISAPGVHTPPDHRIEPDCYFEVTFECVWDDEHGIAVLFNNQGEPVELGGQGSHF
jgi:hypothetical protein